MRQVVKFLKEVRREFKKVRFPNRKETMKLTSLVILATLMAGLYIGALDLLLVKIMAVFIKK